jgi:hypothetical protein
MSALLKLSIGILAALGFYHCVFCLPVAPPVISIQNSFNNFGAPETFTPKEIK